ncbi:MAG: hypothetical protein JXP72_07150 [Coriobacteriia bacterium]|nr:hypothetical protein [Coriobacteriia bacterium]
MVEKLEKILHAEEAARLRLSEARDEVTAVVRGATAEATTIRDEAAREAAEEAARRTAAIMDDATRELERMRATAHAELDALLGAAEGRVPSAVDAVIDQLVE